MEQQSEKKSYRLVWIAVASLIVFFVVFGIALLLVAQSNKGQQATSTNNKETSASQVATKDDMTKNIDTLSGSLKQAASDQAAAKAALADNKNQIKVGS